MKIPLKYGLLTAMGVMAWVLITHSLIPNPASRVHGLGAPIFFNVLLFIMIYLGLKALERERGDRSTFKEALKTGVKISFVYAFTASLFFAGVLMVIGTRWLETEPSVRQGPPSQVAAQAFAFFFLGAMLFGLVYSTLISFFLAKRQSEEN